MNLYSTEASEHVLLMEDAFVNFNRIETELSEVFIPKETELHAGDDDKTSFAGKNPLFMVKLWKRLYAKLGEKQEVKFLGDPWYWVQNKWQNEQSEHHESGQDS
jgi:hypothetical protein